MQQLLIQFPLKNDKKEIWISLLNSNIGLPYTKTMEGFISAEHGISRNEDNDLIWYLWEKWRTKEDYENYISTPPRSKTSKFMEIVLECSNGEMKEIWIDLY